MVNTPVEVFLGLVDGPGLWQALAAQVFWAAATIAMCHLVQSAGLRKLVIHGG